MNTIFSVFSEEDVSNVVDMTDGYSGADMANLCSEAAMGPIRSLDFSLLESVPADEVGLGIIEFLHMIMYNLGT